jgi:aryl-alcohol dehydrogenase-like predicted oxidoreductase
MTLTGIPRRPFGSNGLEVSVPGLGGGQVGSRQSPEADAERLLHQVLDLGLNVIDTARGYGPSDQRIGKYLRHRRQHFVLSTKVGYGVPGHADWTYAAAQIGVNDALRTRQPDGIDVVHLRSCNLEILQRGEVITALKDARRAGKTQAAAYSGEDQALENAVTTGRFQAVQTSINLTDQRNLATRQPETHARGIGVIAKRPVANAPGASTLGPLAITARSTGIVGRPCASTGTAWTGKRWRRVLSPI